MNKREIAKELARKTGSKISLATDMVDAFTEIIIETLAHDEKVQIVGFGTFEARHRAQRKGVNPRNGADMFVSAAKVPTFKAGSVFKEKLREE